MRFKVRSVLVGCDKMIVIHADQELKIRGIQIRIHEIHEFAHGAVALLEGKYAITVGIKHFLIRTRRKTGDAIMNRFRGPFEFVTKTILDRIIDCGASLAPIIIAIIAEHRPVRALPDFGNIFKMSLFSARI